MQSPDDEEARRELVDKTVLLLCAVALNALEFFIPRLPFFPWLKPGIANIVTMIWIIRYGTVDALLFSLVRSWIAGCYFGFSFVSLSLAMSGGVFSTLVMGALWSLFGRRGMMGCIGIGVAGALFHNLGQLLAVYALLTSNTRIFYQFPVMALASVAFGGCVGALVLPFMRMLEGRGTAQNPSAFASPLAMPSPTLSERVTAVVLVAVSFSIVFVTSTVALIIIAAIAAIAVFFLCKGQLSLLAAPLYRFWALFLFIALMYLILPYGTRFERWSFLTHEGVSATLQQWLRLYAWLELSFILARFRFHVVLFAMLSRLFRRREVTLTAGLLAFEYVPLVVDAGRKRGKEFFWNLIRHPLLAAKEGIGGLYDEIVERVGEGTFKN
jgi:heptaprenyl diphosphate synthase